MALLQSFMKLFLTRCRTICLIRTMKLFKMESYQSLMQRRGIISLIRKEDNDLLELTSWCPITLLNVDYKILTKTIAKRIESSLPKLTHSDQTGFIKGIRYIGQNIRLLSNLMEKKNSGIFLFVDFEKAFDSIEWSFINNTLELF